MKENQILRFGGVCAILIGLFNEVSGIIYILLPATQKLGSKGADLLPSVAQNSTMLIALHIGFTLIGIFGLGLVPAIFNMARTAENEGWLRWISNLASLGYAVLAVTGLLVIDRLPRIAQAFVKGDPSTQAALLPVWRTTLDPFGFWSYGVIGLWILLIGVAGINMAKTGSLRSLSMLGVLVGILHLIIPFASVFKMPFLFQIVAGLGLILTTIWYIWTGMVLRGGSSATPTGS